MKFADILKCAKAGISTEEVKAIQALDNVSVDDAIEVVKAGYKIDDIKDLITDDTPDDKKDVKDKKDPEDDKKEDKKDPEDDNSNIKELEDKIAQLTKDLESAQLNNSRKDFGGGEKPDPEEDLVKLFADL